MEKMEGNQHLLRSRNATKIAQKRLLAAKKLLDQNKTDNFYEEIYKGLNAYCTDKLTIGFADLSKDNLRLNLAAKKVSEPTIEKLISTIETCEMARFAASAVNANAQTIYEDAVQIITKIEDEIK